MRRTTGCWCTNDCWPKVVVQGQGYGGAGCEEMGARGEEVGGMGEELWGRGKEMWGRGRDVVQGQGYVGRG